MGLIDKLPSMTDDELANLRNNAGILARNGTAKQKGAIEALMPALDAELAVRNERAAAEKAAKRPPKRSAASKRAKVKDEETDEGARQTDGGAAE